LFLHLRWSDGWQRPMGRVKRGQARRAMRASGRSRTRRRTSSSSASPSSTPTPTKTSKRPGSPRCALFHSRLRSHHRPPRTNSRAAIFVLCLSLSLSFALARSVVCRVSGAIAFP
jgi:hypothetical protein